MDLLQAIEIRVSDRTFTGMRLDAKLRFRLMDTLTLNGPFGTCPRTVLLDAAGLAVPDDAKAAAGESKGARIGTYGIVKSPAAYLAAMVRGRENDRLLFDLGYVVEGLVLEATGLGLGTCWLGGTFDKGKAAAAAGVGDGEALRALIAIGKPARTRGLLDRFIRNAAGSADRLPAEEIARARERDAVAAGLLHEPAVARMIEAVRRAPSASNRQPWRLVLARDEGGAILIDLYLARNDRYERLAGYGIQAVDGGIAARHVEVAANELGFLPERRFQAMEGTADPQGCGFIIGWRLFRR